MAHTGQLQPLGDPSTFYSDASYRTYEYKVMVYEVLTGLHDVKAKSLNALVPVVSSPRPKEKRDAHSRSDGDLLSEAVEALRC